MNRSNSYQISNAYAKTDTNPIAIEAAYAKFTNWWTYPLTEKKENARTEITDQDKTRPWLFKTNNIISYVVALLFYVHGKHLRSCQDGQLT